MEGEEEEATQGEKETIELFIENMNGDSTHAIFLNKSVKFTT